MALRKPSLNLKPLIKAVFEFSELLFHAYRYTGGGVAAGLYWPEFFRTIANLEQVTEEGALPRVAGTDLRRSVAQIRDLLVDIRRCTMTFTEFNSAPLPVALSTEYRELSREFYTTLPKGIFATKRSRDLDNVRTSRTIAPRKHEGGTERPTEFKYGPVVVSQEALGYALHPKRDTLKPSSYKCFHILVDKKSKLPDAPFRIEEGPGRALAVWFRSEAERARIEDLAGKYPGRPSKRAPNP